MTGTSDTSDLALFGSVMLGVVLGTAALCLPLYVGLDWTGLLPTLAGVLVFGGLTVRRRGPDGTHTRLSAFGAGVLGIGAVAVAMAIVLLLFVVIVMPSS